MTKRAKQQEKRGGKKTLTFRERLPLTGDVLCVCFREGTGGDVQDAGIGSARVDAIDGVDRWCGAH